MLFWVNGVLHNGRVAAFGPGDPGSNPGKDLYIIKFKVIILVVFCKNNTSLLALASLCDHAFGNSLVGGDKLPLMLQKLETL